MGGDSPITPMMAQYRRIKGQLPGGALLLFRLGDFYEMFFEDAQRGAEILGVALTRRGVVPMCGIPYHAAVNYIGKLLQAGLRVAICDQLEAARPGTLVKREVTQIISPGTHFDDRVLAPERNNFLAAIFSARNAYGLAVVDLTTGDFSATETSSEGALAAELERLRPAEIIYPAQNDTLAALLRKRAGVQNGYDDWTFASETALYTLLEHFKVAALDGFGLAGHDAAAGAAGAIIHYLGQHLRRDVKHLTRMAFYHLGEYLVLDPVTLRNLEVLETARGDGGSLFHALNRTSTPMGARRLRSWLSQPLAQVAPVERRQNAVEQWLHAPQQLEAFRAELADIRDLARTIGRLSSGAGNARDLVALRLALAQLPKIRQALAALARHLADRPGSLHDAIFATAPAPSLLAELAEKIVELPELVATLARAVVDDPPLALKEGGIIRDGYDAALDEFRSAMRDGKEWIARLQQQEIERTGIASLKVRFNSVFGYYLEVTRANLEKVPPAYIRKQTIAGGERFITAELKEMEGRILGAEERALKLEYDLFLRLREAVVGQLAPLQETAAALADLDVLAAFAEVARAHGYCRPVVRDEGILQIREGRHPVLDQAVSDERFVPNDTQLDVTENQIALITGPNMAGKSTYIRQVALLALLAHAGSFVPAAAARIDILDRIFTRIGAQDDLARGQSTFMVEMTETANILNNATQRSLVILDEIGRGTSTFDGLSLAWSIVEYLHNGIGAKTLFATHYHELTELAARLPRLRNFNVAVREWNEQIIFLRKIVAGGTDKSYGIQVARLAGVPKDVLARAKEILGALEELELSAAGATRPQKRRAFERERLRELQPPPQLDLFGGS